MEVKIGVQHVLRELALETDMTVEQIEAALKAAMDDRGMLVLTDSNGRTLLIPAATLGYLEISGSAERRAGFSL